MSTATALARLLSGGALPLSSAESWTDDRWRHLLRLADRSLCTPLLTRETMEASHASTWFADEIRLRIIKVAVRRALLWETYLEAATALHKSGIEFVLLKGFTHEVGLGIDPATRVQQDIDLLCQPTDLARAREAILQSGFREHSTTALSAEHAPPLVKPHSWRWRGDYFDPEMPIVVELHHSLWSQDRDRISLPGVQDFWTRRVATNLGGLSLPAFANVDRLGFAALHVLRHVLADHLRPGQAWELSLMMNHHLHDKLFWAEWQRLHPPQLRRLQSIAFYFTRVWFDQQLPEAVEQECKLWPESLHAWFSRFQWSPIQNLEVPNKDALRLHLALLPQLRDRVSVARRRLLPLRIPRPAEAVDTSFAAHLLARSRYHAGILAGSIWRGVRTPAAASITSEISD